MRHSAQKEHIFKMRSKNNPPIFWWIIFLLYLCKRNRWIAKENERNGALAQLVEHRTENPCVPGSIPGGTTPPFISPVIG